MSQEYMPNKPNSIAEKMYSSRVVMKYQKDMIVCIFFITIAFLVNIYTWSFWTGDVFPRYSSESILKSARINIPSYYSEVANFINSQPSEFRVLGLPSVESPPSGWVPYTWGYLGVDPLYHYLVKSYLIENSWKIGIHQKLYALTSGKSSIKKLLPLSAYLNIKYILVRKDVDYKFYAALPPENISHELSACGLKLEKVFNKIEVYAIPGEYFLPKIYQASTLILINGSIEELIPVVSSKNYKIKNSVIVLFNQTNKEQWEFLKNYNDSTIITKHVVFLKPTNGNTIALHILKLTNLTKLDDVTSLTSIITFKKINPTKYIVSVENATQPFFLVFSESYHPQWKIYIEDRPTNFTQIIANYPKVHVKEAKHEWYKFTPGDIVYLFKKPAVNATLHFMANGYANAWYIDPRVFDRDGDGCFTIIIYFWPQSLFYLGLFVSGTTLLCCIGYLVYDWYRSGGGRRIRYVLYFLRLSLLMAFRGLLIRVLASMLLGLVRVMFGFMLGLLIVIIGL